MGLCERCKKAQATFHLTNIDPDGEKSERHLCDRCANEEGLVQAHAPAATADVIESFISSKAAKELNTLVCENCGISYVEFRNHSQLGCPADYDVFKEYLTPLIQRNHDGATHHTGKSPRAEKKPRPDAQELRRLRKLLEEAVAAEDYERAADLRDRIRRLETST